MFRIRRIHDDVLPVNQAAIREVRQIFAEQFPAAPPGDIEHLTEKLRNPFKQRFRSVLYVAENARGKVTGFAIVLHEPELRFCYLDFVATGKTVTGRGVGAALYEHVRDEAAGLGAQGLFFECLPDEPAACADPAIRRQNSARLKFYERYGARPIVGTAYESPVPDGGSDNLPHLMYDDLDTGRPLRQRLARDVVRAVLERKYGDICPPEYVRSVVDSFRDDPVRIREPRHLANSTAAHRPATPRRTPFPMAINDRHAIHHIRERGYVESPVRITAIRKELEGAGLCRVVPTREFPLKHVLAVHDHDYVDYLRRACELAPEGKSVYPYVFPIRNATRPPKEMLVRAGYYCIDTFTPINRNAYSTARRGVDATLTAADELLRGARLAYALVRPPGHHAEHRSFGGFCYFNNAAVAAKYLGRLGRVAILDIDYHHGNGQQEIFYESPEVLTVSIHGDPDFAYPYFTGFADERGAGAGLGFNLNLALPEEQDGAQYLVALDRALVAIREYSPLFLVVCLGLDPAKGDPTGSWSLAPRDFEQNGRRVGSLGTPTLVVQEGGYRTRTLGTNARHFFQGLMASLDHGGDA